MDTKDQLIDLALYATIILGWTMWSRLDLGLRRPDLRRAWPWIALCIAMDGLLWLIDSLVRSDIDSDWLAWVQSLSAFEELLFLVLLGPLLEEFLFRGAMFAALFRRWGIWPAIIIPSLVWSLLHIQYELWFMAWTLAFGILLAVTRWKSGSIFAPLALHMLFNLESFAVARLL